MVIATPSAEDRTAFYSNQKINCMRAAGIVTYGNQQYHFDPADATATLDWGRGVWTYRNTWYWGDIHIENLGMQRASKISPAETAIHDGVVYTFHQDSPVVPPDMLHTVWCAVNRITKQGVLLGEEERITPYEALKAVTIHAAYQYFEEHVKGSIKEGKLADLILLDQNPLTIDPMKIKDIRVIETIKEGNTVYSCLGVYCSTPSIRSPDMRNRVNGKDMRI